MTDNEVARVRYHPGQYLRTADFTAEQRYHLAMRRRHLIGHHTFGIVGGLELVEQDGALWLTAGTAVDGYGRELVVPERRPVDVPRAFDERGSDTLDVWLVYARVATTPAEAGWGLCEADEDTTSRVVEQPLIRFTLPNPDDTDRRSPRTVPEGDRPFAAHRVPPDETVADWPVFLGTVTRGSDDPERSYTVAIDGRPWVGLVGEEVQAASGRARVQIGAERADDPYRFAVRVGDTPTEEVPRLAVLRDGRLVLVGSTAFLGNLTVAGRLQIDAAGERSQAQPWTLSHVAGDNGEEELRIELGATGGTSAVVVGTWTEVPQPDGSEEPAFKPCLTVRDDCSVVVHGNLAVEGSITAEGGVLPTGFAPEAAAFLGGAFLSGAAGATGLVDRFYESPFDGGDPVVLARMIAANRSRIAELVGELGNLYPQAAQELKDALESE